MYNCVTDAGNTATSNWVRWVNCARNPQELNLDSIWCYGRVYYISTKDIYPGQELLVYYGQGYAKSLGIDVQLFGHIYRQEDDDDDEDDEEEEEESIDNENESESDNESDENTDNNDEGVSDDKDFETKTNKTVIS